MTRDSFKPPTLPGMRRLALWLLCSLALVLFSHQAQAQTPLDWRFGVVESTESPTDAADLGAAWTRIRFQWAEVQADGPTSWDPPITDAALTTEASAGREIVGMLIGIPDWARGPDLLPAGLWLPPDDPGNLWARFARQAANRYAGTIDHWIIWNEPDVWDKTTPGHTWDGDEGDFLQLQRVAYQSIKSANPNAIVHLAAMTYFWDAQFGREQYLSRLLDEIVADPAAAAHNHYFDIATAHLYFQPTAVYDILTAFQSMMADHGLDKPIWLVETNAPPSEDPAWPVNSVTLRVTLHEQAHFMPQALAVALAAGADRIAIYKLKDTESDALANPEPFGLVRLDGTRRPAFDSARRAFQLLSGVVAAERERWDEVGQVRLTHTDRLTTVLFSRLPASQTAEVPAIAPTARLISATGEESLITSDNGVFRLTLPPALCAQSIGDYCMIGGETFYLVQALDGGPPPEAAPPAIATPTPLPTPSPMPTETPTATPTPLPSATPSSTPTPLPTSTPSPQPTASPAPIPTPTLEPAPEPRANPGQSLAWLLGAGALVGLGLMLLSRRRR